jgi:hypothetical protein
MRFWFGDVVQNTISDDIRGAIGSAQPPKTSKYELWIASNQPKTVQGSVELRFLSVNNPQSGGEDMRFWFGDVVQNTISDDIRGAIGSNGDT